MAIEKQTYRNGPFKEFIAEGTRVGNVVYLSGQVAVDSEGKTPIGLPDQVSVVYANIKHVLAQFDAHMGNIVDETVYVTDVAEMMSQANVIYGIRETAYGCLPEVSQTVVQVGALVMPELKIEIKVVAHL